MKTKSFYLAIVHITVIFTLNKVENIVNRSMNIEDSFREIILMNYITRSDNTSEEIGQNVKTEKQKRISM
jgi:hypothetical protein